MQVQDELHKLMQKDMDRKEFIKHVGVGFAAIAGLGTVLKTLSSMNGNRQVSTGYGSSVYGGVSAAAKSTKS